MPRPRKNAASGGPSLTPGQASYVLDRLVAERRISPSEISRYVGEMGREISELEQRLQRLRDAAGPAAAAAAGFAAGAVFGRRRGRPPGRPPGRPAAAKSAAKRGRRRRSAITPEQLASRQLQGRYLALVRRFAKNRRAQFAKTAKDKGREAAIKEMQEALKK